jgi:AraC-like DNA-binding protein
MVPIIHPILALLSSRVVAAGKQTMPLGWSLRPRSLEVHDLIYIRGGAGDIFIGSRHSSLLAGQWFLLPAGVPHQIEHKGDSPLRLWVLHFTVQSEWENPFGKYLELLDTYLLPGDRKVRFLMDQAIAAHKTEGEIQSILTNRTLDLLLSYLLKDSSSLVVKDSRITKALTIMNEEYGNKLNLSSLGKRVGLSPYHFRYLFSELMGISPSASLRNLRLQKAKEFLQGTDFSLQEIANRTGWENASTFIRTFTKHNGVTPGKFRELNKFSGGSL